MAEPPSSGETSGEQRIHPRAAFRSKPFRQFQLMRFLALNAIGIQTMAVAWHLFVLTHSALYLGYIGLALFLPQLIFPLIAGHAADRFDRKRIMLTCDVALLLLTLALAAFTAWGPLRVSEAAAAAAELSGHTAAALIPGAPALLTFREIFPLLVILFLIGTSKTFLNPAGSALMPRLVPREHFPNAIVWHSFNFQLSTTLAGILIGALIYLVTKNVDQVRPEQIAALAAQGGMVHVEYLYLLTAGLTVASILILLGIDTRGVPGSAPIAAPNKEKMTWGTVLAGMRYIRKRPVLLGAISLDLFAVLLGGATALMPVVALQILQVGNAGVGKFEAAQYTGALIMGLIFTSLPPIRRAGRAMFACVAGFGVLTIAFGLSKSFALSLAVVAALGALDMVSVIIRQSMIQLRTPDSMRGRVTAVNMIFVGASNQLGEFESGLTAHWWGTVPAIVVGGIGTLVVVVLWSVWFPELRKFGRLDTEHTPSLTEGEDEKVREKG